MRFHISAAAAVGLLVLSPLPTALALPSPPDDVDVLPVGHRLENWGASCGIGEQGTVICKTSGRHGFSLDTASGVLW
ncbi:hypothetical protein [Mycolicibacterium nivoides]|uniref:hypothetical protein n=1 Tax=Mycolicibacterium nivoides TaxID=2487344 RepID=UPI003C2E60E7